MSRSFTSISLHECASVCIGAACQACAAWCSDSARPPEVHTVTASGQGSAAAAMAARWRVARRRGCGPRGRGGRRRGRQGRGTAGDQVAWARRGQFVGGGPVPGVGPRRVEHHRLAEAEQPLGPAQQLGVGALGPLGRVDALAVRRGGRAGPGRARRAPCGAGRWRAARAPSRSASAPASVDLPVPGSPPTSTSRTAPARRCRSARSA